MTAAHHRAHSAYQAGAVLASDPRQVVWLLHDGVTRHLRSAKIAYEKKELDQTCRHLARANKIIGALLTNLRFEEAGAPGLALRKLYICSARRLLRVVSDSNATETLQQCADVFQMLRDDGDKQIQVETLQYR